MKIAIILPCEIDKSPYIKYYSDVLDSIGVEYEIICWDRDIYNTNIKSDLRIYSFNRVSSELNHNFKKIFDYWLFSRFVVDILKKNNFEFLIVHTIVNAIFLSGFLNNSYKNKYIFDIRDYSPIVPLCSKSLKKIIINSAFTTISSIGFKKWLPKNIEYIIGHNITKEAVNKTTQADISNPLDCKKILTVLTIGQIRNFEVNARLISSLGNKSDISLVFAGGGLEKDNLMKYSKRNFNNVIFTGKYDKINESNIVTTADFINILLPTTKLERTLMSNRFYLSLVFRKPMIVNEESIQSLLVRKYCLGIVLKSSDNLYEKLVEYRSSFNFQTFNEGCEKLLYIIKNDITLFEKKIIDCVTD